MRSLLLRIAIGVTAFVAAFAAITLIALEGSEVVVLRTHGGDGATRETRTWIADEGGHAYVETANLERPFYLHVLADPNIEVLRNGEVQKVHATPLPQQEGHTLIRRLLAAKYGWADSWIGLIADTSASTAIRLDPR